MERISRNEADMVSNEDLKAYPADASSCYFPRLVDGLNLPAHRRQIGVDLDTDAVRLDRFLAENGVTLPALVQTTWALVLARYVGTDDVKFEFVTSQPDDTQKFICQARLQEAAPILQLLQGMHAQHGRGLQYDLSSSMHPKYLSGQSRVNTSVRLEVGCSCRGDESLAEVSFLGSRAAAD